MNVNERREFLQEGATEVRTERRVRSPRLSEDFFFAIEIKRGSREPGKAVPVVVPRVVCPGLKIKRGQTKAEALNFLCQTLTTRLHISSKLFFFVETSHISYAGLT